MYKAKLFGTYEMNFCQGTDLCIVLVEANQLGPGKTGTVACCVLGDVAVVNFKQEVLYLRRHGGGTCCFLKNFNLLCYTV